MTHYFFFYFNLFEDKQIEFYTKYILYQHKNMSNDALPFMSGCLIVVVVVLFPCFCLFVCLFFVFVVVVCLVFF